ncbi:MAG TPA: hypothetical protein VHW72_03255 [Candidatus Angelobacter sp.]|nr:hypothetical protein [Candidatus Angelobacter sp.]
MTVKMEQVQVRFVTLTPKAERLEQLRAQGKSFDEALAIADREFTPDGLLPRRGVTSLEAALSGGVAQMGEVQF